MMIDIQTYRNRIGCYVHRNRSDKPGCRISTSNKHGLSDKHSRTYRASALTSNTSDHSDKPECRTSVLTSDTSDNSDKPGCRTYVSTSDTGDHNDKPGCRTYVSTSDTGDHNDEPGCMDSLSLIDSNTTMDTTGALPFITMLLLMAVFGICFLVMCDHSDEPGSIGRLSSMDSNKTMATSGAVSFINMLLLIAGVESNPGPTDVFVFRYHYLLIQVGSEVLRKVFDKLVGNDFMRYLFADPTRTDYNQLQYLINTNKISDHMKQFLPPLDNKPMSSNFDITLLALLLRNVCGLKPRNDTVWTTPPAPGCVSLEEDVTRLRLCRNELQHITSVTITETEFTAKWGELCRILHRLNYMSGGPLLQLQPMIDNAETVVLDEKLKEQLDASIEAWKENDELIEKLKEDVDKVKSDITVVRTVMSDVKGDVDVVKSYMNVVKDDMDVVKGDMDVVKGDVNVVKGDMDVVKGDMDVVKGDMSDVKGDVDDVKSDMNVVKGDMDVVKGDMDVVKGDMSDVKGDMDVVKGDMNVVKGDMNVVKGDMNVVKGDMDGVKCDMDVVKCDMDVVKGDMNVVKGDMDVVKGDMNVVKGDMDVVKGDMNVVKGDMNVVKGDMNVVKGDMDGVKCDMDVVKDDMDVVKGDMDVVKGDMDVVKEGIIAVKGDVEEVLTKIKTIETDVKQVFPDKKGHHTETEDIRDQLIRIYQDECSEMPVSPIYEKDEMTKLLLTYKSPSLWNVPYHRTELNESKYNVTSYKKMFHKDDQQFRKIFITGDAGVGKSTFCKRMALIWTMAKLGKSVDGSGIQDDIDFMKKFELVYYISLSGTSGNDVVQMSVDQLFETDNGEEENKIYRDVKRSLRENACLVILDALDERTGNGITNINRVLSDKSTYLCTCRPYRIEQDRLYTQEIDRQILLTGINENSIELYVDDIVTYLNKANRCNKSLQDFFKDVKICGLYNQLHIPIIAAHLVAVWFDHSLTNMSQGHIYNNIVDMLFKRAEKVKHIDLTSSTKCDYQFPASLSELYYLKRHASFLKKVCLLAFNLLFKRDKSMSKLIFTVEQLELEPYCVSVEEINFLCKIGVLSKSKVICRIGGGEQKLAFVHKTYMEYFTALFVTSFDTNNAFDDVVMSWSLINDVVQYETFFIFFAGLSYLKSKICFENIHAQIQNDLHSSLINDTSCDEVRHMRSLQSIVLKCLKEVREYSDTPISYRLAHFIFDSFDDDSSDDDSSDDLFSLVLGLNRKYSSTHLKSLLLLNISNIKGLHCVDGKYHDEFNQVNSLQYLSVGGCENESFNQLLINNQSTLHTVRIKSPASSLVENVIKLPHLKSIYIDYVFMSHGCYHDLIGYLSSNIHMEKIKLSIVKCDTHGYGGCSPPALNLVNHSQLHSLYLNDVNVTCNTVNTSSLKSLILRPLNWNIDFGGILNSINSSMVESLHICKYYMFSNDTANTLLSVVPTLSCLTYLKLEYMKFPADCVLRLHCDIRDAEINLHGISMSRACFAGFIDSLCNIKSHIKVRLDECTFYTGDGDTWSDMSKEKSVDYMTDCLKQKLPNVNITNKFSGWLEFETSGCQ